MGKFDQKLLESDIEVALKFCKWMKNFRFILAAAIVVSYFFFKDWLAEILLVAVLILLLFPLGFFDVFIQKLLEYNTQILEDRLRLNATEANQHFQKLFDKVESLEIMQDDYYNDRS
ncbi:hypothetical protein [Salinibius halmophilus]|uniref:hypothetical protein n=1 Tax=Salinibius halmophilus TaxID=1853216 RepID=UPI000E6726AD|nr:hypothetical protein [Salinibius halmophilus]